MTGKKREEGRTGDPGGGSQVGTRRRKRLGEDGGHHEAGWTMSTWPRENCLKDTSEQSEQSKTLVGKQDGAHGSNVVRIAQSLSSLSSQLNDKNTKFLCLLFRSYVG